MICSSFPNANDQLALVVVHHVELHEQLVIKSRTFVALLFQNPLLVTRTLLDGGHRY